MSRDEAEPRGRGRPKRQARGETLDAAMGLYWSEGVASLSLNEVCRRISASKPAIYREFGGEDGLQDAVLGHYRDRVVAPVLQYVAADRPLHRTLEGLVQGMTAPVEHPPGCLFTEMRLLRSRLGPQSLLRLEAIEEERRDAFTRWYARALDRGEGNPALSPVDAADYLDAQLTLLLVQMGMGEAPEGVRARSRLALAMLQSPG